MLRDIRVSIITPSFNQGQFIEETILSVLNQSYKNIQYILVDGGSTDNTMQVVEKYQDRIDIVISERDNGQSDAINKGFRLADGELVGWINSDDLLYPYCVEEIVKLYQDNSSAAILYSANLNLIDSKSEFIQTNVVKIVDRDYLLRSSYSVIQPGSFYRADLLRNINYIDQSIHYCMDLDLWLKLLNHGSICYVDSKPLASFRIWGESKTSTGGEGFLKEIRSVLRRNGARNYDATVMKAQRGSITRFIRKLIQNRSL